MIIKKKYTEIFSSSSVNAAEKLTFGFSAKKPKNPSKALRVLNALIRMEFEVLIQKV
jgi:hypothetical protein